MVNFSGLQFHDGAPVYQQIAEYLKRQILTGAVQGRRSDAQPAGAGRADRHQPQHGPKGLPPDDRGGLCRHGRQQRQLSAADPALREKIDEELTRGLVEDFVARAKANRLSYKKVIALVSELWDDEA